MRPTRPVAILTAIGLFDLFILTAAPTPGTPSGWLSHKHAALPFAHVANCIILAEFPRPLTPGTRFRRKLNKGGYHHLPPECRMISFGIVSRELLASPSTWIGLKYLPESFLTKRNTVPGRNRVPSRTYFKIYSEVYLCSSNGKNPKNGVCGVLRTATHTIFRVIY